MVQNYLTTQLQSGSKTSENDETETIQQKTRSRKFYRYFIYFSLYIYVTIMCFRLVLLFYKLDDYLKDQEYNRPYLAVFQMAQILPSMLFGYIYDCLHKWTNLEISTILMSILGLGLVCLLNLFTIELMMIAAFVLTASLNGFTCGLQACFASKFADKPKNIGLIYGYLTTSYSLASIPIIQEKLAFWPEKTLFFLFLVSFVFPAAMFGNKTRTTDK